MRAPGLGRLRGALEVLGGCRRSFRRRRRLWLRCPLFPFVKGLVRRRGLHVPAVALEMLRGHEVAQRGGVFLGRLLVVRGCEGGFSFLGRGCFEEEEEEEEEVEG